MTAETVVLLRLRGDAGQLIGEIRGTSGATKQFGTEAGKAGADAERGFRRAGQGASELRGIVNSVRTAVLGLASAAAVLELSKKAIAGADAYKNIQGRLDLASKSQAQFNTANRETYAIAQRTSSGLTETVTLYTRLQKATEKLGLTQRDSLTLTESINQSFGISNATTSEAANSTRQLAQALASGVLRGDEFNSVMENSPRLQQALSDALGKTSGELRKMAEEGELTADIVVKALLTQAPKMAAEYARVPITVERALVQVENAFIRSIGRIDQTFGASTTLAQGLQGLAANLESVLVTAVRLGQVMIVGLFARGLVSGTNVVTAWISKLASARQALLENLAAQESAARASVAGAAAKARETEATLIAINAARNEAIARLQVAQADIQAARATIAATEAIGAQSLAIRENARATEAYNVAALRRTALQTELALLGKQTAAVEATLATAARSQTAAQVGLATAQASTAAATSLAARAMGGLRTAGTALFALVGGWPTIIAAAVAGIYLLSQSIKNAEQDAEAAAQNARDERAKLNEDILAQQAAARRANPRLIQQDITRVESQIDRVEPRSQSGAYSGAYKQQLEDLQAQLKKLRAEYDQATGAATGFADTLSGKRGDIDTYIKSLTKQNEGIKEQVISTKEGAVGLAKYRLGQLSSAAATNEQKAAIQKLLADLAENEAALKRLTATGKDQAKTVRQQAKDTRDFAADVDRLSKSSDRFAELQEQLTQEFGGPGLAALRRYQSAMDLIDKYERDFVKLVPLTVAASEAIADARNKATQSLKQEQAAIERQQDIVGRSLEPLEDEVRLLGFANDEREIEEALLRANAEARQQYEAHQERSIELTAQETASLRERMGTLIDQRKALEAADQVRQAWTGAMTSISQSFGDFVSRGFKGWKDFLGNAKEALRRWIAEVIALMAQRALVQAFSGGGGGGFLGGIASLIGGGGAGGGGGVGGLGGMGNGLTSQVGGTYALPIGGAIAGGLYGFTQRGNGGASSLGAGVAYGTLGYAAGTVALGAGLGAGAGAAVGAAGAGAASGAMGAAMAIPVAGWIIAAIAVLDMITGGKVFGTKFAPKGYTQGINVSETGGSASLTVQESRQRALFGGTQNRTRSLDPGAEAQGQAAELFKATQAAADAVGELFGVAGQVVAGSFTRVLDKKGKKVKEEFSTFFGVKYKEDAEAFATRLVAEAQIATVDAFLASLRTGEGSVDAVSQEAHNIAQRWRGSAATLADGAQFLVMAAQDMKNSAGLLGASGTLTETADLIEELAKSGESIAGAYQRVSAATRLLDDVLKVSGVTIDKTREEIVRFAVGIADAAGGLDQAQGLFQNYYNRAYSPEERSQRILGDATTERDAQLTGLGLDTNISIADFRELFEQQLPSLSAEAVVQWLKAFAAITRVTDAEAQLADVRSEAAEQAEADAERARQNAEDLEALLGDVTWNDYLDGLSQFDRELAELRKRWEEIEARAVALGASEEQLTIIRDAGERAVRRLTEAQQAQVQTYDQWLATTMQQQEDLRNQQAQLLRDAFAGIRDYLNGELFSETSQLTPLERLQAAQQQFNDLLVRARGGDLEAARQIQAAAARLQAEQLAYYGGGADYERARDAVRAALQPLADMFGNGQGSLPNVLASLDEAIRRFTEYLAHPGSQIGTNNTSIGQTFANAYAAGVAANDATGGVLIAGNTNDPNTESRSAKGDAGDIKRQLMLVVSESNRKVEERLASIERTITRAGSEIAQATRLKNYAGK